MKTKKVSRVLALLLSLVMLLGTLPTAFAESDVVTSEAEYEAMANEAVVKMYDKLMAAVTWEEILTATAGMTRAEIENFLNRLIDENLVDDPELANYDAYVWSLFEDYMLRAVDRPEVNYTKVAPLVDFSNTAAVATYSLMVAAEADSDETTDSGLKLSKSATLNSDNKTGTIRLEAFSTGSLTESLETTAIDVIIVVDMSGSMSHQGGGSEPGTIPNYEYTEYTGTLKTGSSYWVKYNEMYVEVVWCDTCNAWTYGCYHTAYNGYTATGIPFATDGTTTFYTRTENGTAWKLETLQEAVSDFVSQFAAASTVADNRIAFVKFNGNDKAKVVKGTTTATASTAFINMKTDSATAVTTAASTNNTLWGTSQGTYIDDGTQLAVDILKAYYGATPTETDLAARKRVVIVFTDGIPSGTKTETAGDSIYDAYTMKNTYQSTVYSVGVVDGADGSIPFVEGNSSFDINQFLHYMSSNFPTATSYNDDGDGAEYATPQPSAGSYYLSAGDADALKNIFALIANKVDQEIESSTTLGKTSSVVDVLMPYLALPANVTTDNIDEHIVIKTADYESQTTDSEGKITYEFSETEEVYADGDAVLNADGSIGVTNFDFISEWCGPETDYNGDVTPHGRKLIIEIPFVVDEDFLGGNLVYTNEDDVAGIYDSEGNFVQEFNRPTVNVPIKTITPVIGKDHIYVTNTADLLRLISTYADNSSYHEYTLKIDGTDKTFKVDGVNNSQVKIVYTFAKKDGTEITKYTIEAGDTTGTFSVEGMTSVAGLDDDTEYVITCTVSPIVPGEGEYGEKTSDHMSGWVYVYKPILEYKDSSIDYLTTGVTLDDYYVINNLVSKEEDDNGDEVPNPTWKRKDGTASTAVTMSGEEPKLQLDYSESYTWLSTTTNGQVTGTNDVAVNVTITANDTDITEYTTSIRNGTACSQCDETGTDLATVLNPEFVVHILNTYGNLEIVKNGLLEGESAIFTVKATRATGTDEETWTIVLTGDGSTDGVSATITGLKANSDYSVEEQGAWVWGYTVSPTGEQKGVIVAADTATEMFTNTKDEQWLYDESAVANTYKKSTSSSTETE